MKPSDVRDLIAKLEAAREGSEELNEAILVACGWRRLTLDDEANAPLWASPSWDWKTPTGYCPNHALPDVSRSLDAALSLVPEGWHWSIYDTDGAGKACAQVEPPEFSHEPVTGSAATPALATVIACLKARFPDAQ